MNKLSPEQVKEAHKLLKALVVKTKKLDPDVTASAVIGLMARMCYVASSGDMQTALGFVENMTVDVQTMLFNLDTAYKVEKEMRDVPTN